jgi:hypothetical protein
LGQSGIFAHCFKKRAIVNSVRYIFFDIGVGCTAMARWLASASIGSFDFAIRIEDARTDADSEHYLAQGQPSAN